MRFTSFHHEFRRAPGLYRVEHQAVSGSGAQLQRPPLCRNTTTERSKMCFFLALFKIHIAFLVDLISHCNGFHICTYLLGSSAFELERSKRLHYDGQFRATICRCREQRCLHEGPDWCIWCMCVTVLCFPSVSRWLYLLWYFDILCHSHYNQPVWQQYAIAFSCRPKQLQGAHVGEVWNPLLYRVGCDCEAGSNPDETVRTLMWKKQTVTHRGIWLCARYLKIVEKSGYQALA